MEEVFALSDNRIKVRIKFKKYGAMKFIGHLDIMRFFQKLFRRSFLDVAYSEGFHPHQIMSFANPLGVGLTSNGEYLDVTMNSAVSSEDIVSRLNNVTVEGVDIISAVKLPEGAQNGMASVSRADYTVTFRKGYEPKFDLQEKVNKFYSQSEIIVEKKTKKGSKTLNLKDSIHILTVDQNSIFMQVNAGSSENIRPELVIQSIYDYACQELPDFSFEICREEQYDENGKTLLEAGDIF